MEDYEMGQHYIEESWQKPIQKMEIGDRITTKSRIITRSELELLAVIGGDYAPQFLSEEAAKAHGWKTQLVPGVITLHIAYGLLIQAGFLRDVIAYMASSNLRFLGPVYPGDGIRVEAKVTDKKRTDKGWLCEYDFFVRNQKEEVLIEGHNV
jgi:oxepin-CoA hydrolase/3-oxo-5,6-dehydrosuberyl-CoA semialdehyde dehydrogenase